MYHLVNYFISPLLQVGFLVFKQRLSIYLIYHLICRTLYIIYVPKGMRERERKDSKETEKSLSFLIFFLSFFFLCVYDPRIGCGALKNPAVPSLHLLYLSLSSVILLTSSYFL